MEAPSPIGQESHAASHGTVNFGMDCDTKDVVLTVRSVRVLSSEWLRMVTCRK